MKNEIFIVCLSFLLLVSCARGTDANNTEIESSSLNECASHIELKYAKKFSISAFDFGYMLRLSDGNSETLNKCYYFVRNDSVALPSSGIKIKIPISGIASNTTTIFEFLRQLDCLSSLKATCSSDYIYSDDICSAIEKGKIISLGNSFNLNRERLLSSSVDLLLLSDISDTPMGINIPILYVKEWEEVHPLARAEWIKLFGVMFDRYSLADSLFHETERKYLELKEMVANVDLNRPSLFSGGSYSGTWYLTGGNGFMAEMYRDAGANFLLADTAVGTIACGLEWLVSEFSEAEFWVNCGDLSMENWDTRLKHLKSVQNKNVYHFLKRSKLVNGVGISDFYEGAVAHPELLLADLISVLHPELLPLHESVYIDKCEGGIK